MAPTKTYMPETMGVIVALGALAVWYFSSLAIDKSVVPSSYQWIVTFATSAFGAFFGAYCAFKLRQHEENQSKLKKRKAALDACHFTMARQYNAINRIKLEYEKFENRLARAFQMPAAKPPEYDDLVIKFDDLLFLADHDGIDLLFQLSIQQECFEQTLRAINSRNAYAVERMQPALERYDLNGKPVTAEQLKQAMGDVVYTTALNAADAAYEYVIETEESLAAMQNRLFEIAKAIFPRERFLKIGDKKPLPHAGNTETNVKSENA